MLERKTKGRLAGSKEGRKGGWEGWREREGERKRKKEKDRSNRTEENFFKNLLFV